MYFIQVNGQVRRTFFTLPQAKNIKAKIVRAYNTLRQEGLMDYTPEVSLYEQGELGYPYADARKIS